MVLRPGGTLSITHNSDDAWVGGAMARVALDEQRMLSRGAGLPLPRLGERAGVRGLHKSRFGETPLTPTLSPSLGRGSAGYEMRSELVRHAGRRGMGSADSQRPAGMRRQIPSPFAPHPMVLAFLAHLVIQISSTAAWARFA